MEKQQEQNFTELVEKGMELMKGQMELEKVDMDKCNQMVKLFEDALNIKEDAYVFHLYGRAMGLRTTILPFGKEQEIQLLMALNYLSKAVNIEPDDGEFHFWRAFVMLDLHRYANSDIEKIEKLEETKREYQLALSLEPKLESQVQNDLHYLNQFLNELRPAKSGCFIATAAFGTKYVNEVIYLSNFRDKVLQKYILGRYFIKFYYKISPFLASIIEDHSTLKYLVRNILIKPMIHLMNYFKI